MDEKFIPIEEVMRELGISRRTVFYLVQRGKLRKFKTTVGRGHGGRRTYFSVTQARTLIKPVPIDSSTLTDDEVRAINAQFDQVQQEWLDKQRCDLERDCVVPL